MDEKDGASYVMRIGGNVDGQVAQGTNINQSSVASTGAAAPEADLAALRDLIAELRREVAAQAPEEQRDAALERIDELEEAVVADEPDLGRMNAVRNWFTQQKLHHLAGVVYGAIAGPVVTKIVEAAGEEAASAFHGFFG